MFVKNIESVICVCISLNLLKECWCEDFVESSLAAGRNEAAKFKSYLFVASIVRAQHGVCTGSLITRQYVLTSAICSFSYFDEFTETPVPEFKSSFELRLKSDRVDSGGSLHSILHIYIHPKFRAVDVRTQHDLSIFKIVWIFIFGSSLSLISATFLNDRMAVRYMEHQTKCETVGWGYASSSQQESDANPEELRRVDTKIVPWHSCRSMNVQSIDESTEFCGLVPEKTCLLPRGSGSPLICNGDIVGLASWGARCGKEQQPLIYTRLDSWVMPFIRTRYHYSRKSSLSQSTKLHTPRLLSLLALIAYPLFVSLTRRYNIFTKYTN